MEHSDVRVFMKKIIEICKSVWGINTMAKRKNNKKVLRITLARICAIFHNRDEMGIYEKLKGLSDKDMDMIFRIYHILDKLGIDIPNDFPDFEKLCQLLYNIEMERKVAAMQTAGSAG